MSKKGFTLIELLVVVAVLALLASIVTSNLGGAREGARISNALSFQSQTHSLLGSDLVGWWNFNDPDARYKDLSGYGNHGSCTSCPTVTDGVPGTGGSAMEFDGVGDYVNAGNNTSLNVSNEITLSAWFYSDDFIQVSVPLVKHLQYRFHFHTNENLYTDYYDAEGNRYYSAHSYALLGIVEDSRWYYITIVYTGYKTQVYINGEKKSDRDQGNGGIRSNQGNNFYIGSVAGGHPFNGLIDDVRIYSRALSASEIQTLYTQTKDRYLANE